MHDTCGQLVERLGKALVQLFDKYTTSTAGHTTINSSSYLLPINSPSLSPETAINTQPIFGRCHLIGLSFYTLCTGPTNTNILNKE